MGKKTKRIKNYEYNIIIPIWGCILHVQNKRIDDKKTLGPEGIVGGGGVRALIDASITWLIS